MMDEDFVNIECLLAFGDTTIDISVSVLANVSNNIPVGSYLGSNVLHTPNAHRINHPYTSLQNHHHSSSPRLQTPSSTEIDLIRSPP